MPGAKQERNACACSHNRKINKAIFMARGERRRRREVIT